MFCFLLVYLMVLSVTHFLQLGDWMIKINDLKRMIDLKKVIVT